MVKRALKNGETFLSVEPVRIFRYMKAFCDNGGRASLEHDYCSERHVRAGHAGCMPRPFDLE